MRKINIIDSPNLDNARIRSLKSNTFLYSYLPSNNTFSYLKGKKYYIKTYGCQANIRDEETLSGLLNSLNMTKVYSRDEADVAIINTCAVRENAEDHVYGELGEYKKIKKNKKDLILMICGCMVEQKHIIDYIFEKFPYLDICFGTHNIQDLIKLLDIYLNAKGNERIIDVSSKVGDIYENLPCERLSNFKAYVNIAYGCDKFCTYCIVPYTRGKERSRSVEDILKECRELEKQGYKEITLLGQNVDSYGKDFNNDIDFAYLLDEVAKLDIPRIRFLTSYPSDFKDDVIDVIAKHKNIMKYLHLPIQSGDNNVLKRMARRYTVEDYLELVKKIKNKIPQMEFSTDIIVGFPNETEEEFENTIKLVKNVDYISAFTFIYSPRKGTPAAKIKDEVLYETKVKRFIKLKNELEEGFKIKGDAMVGNTYEVLVDGFSKKDHTLLTGITEGMKSVHFKGDESLIGKIVKVKITKNKVYSFHGELINE